jgi:GTP-binding nuclear protein Ran
MASSLCASPLTFKVVLVGDGGVGKTTFLHQHCNGAFEPKYVPSMGASVQKLNFQTTQGEIVLNVWDCAGQVQFQGLQDCYYVSADAALLMFDVTSQDTYKNLGLWYDALRAVHPGNHTQITSIPIVVLGNKVDCKHRQVIPKDIRSHRYHNLKYYDISVKSKLSLEKPFLHLIKKLLNDSTVEFVSPVNGIDLNHLTVTQPMLTRRSTFGDVSIDPNLTTSSEINILSSFPLNTSSHDSYKYIINYLDDLRINKTEEEANYKFKLIEGVLSGQLVTITKDDMLQLQRTSQMIKDHTQTDNIDREVYGLINAISSMRVNESKSN